MEIPEPTVITSSEIPLSRRLKRQKQKTLIDKLMEELVRDEGYLKAKALERRIEELREEQRYQDSLLGIRPKSPLTDIVISKVIHRHFERDNPVRGLGGSLSLPYERRILRALQWISDDIVLHGFPIGDRKQELKFRRIEQEDIKIIRGTLESQYPWEVLGKLAVEGEYINWLVLFKGEKRWTEKSFVEDIIRFSPQGGTAIILCPALTKKQIRENLKEYDIRFEKAGARGLNLLVIKWKEGN